MRGEMRSGTKGRLTFRSTGALLALSAIFEAFSLTSEVTLLGAVRGGLSAVLYHLAYSVLFLAMGIGLWRAQRWGYQLVFIGTWLYTIDKALYLTDRKSMEAGMLRQIGGHGEVWQLIDKGSVLQLMSLATVLFVASWWGFALFTYIRRDYFSSGKTESGEAKE